MAALASGIFSHAMTSAQSLMGTGANPTATPTTAAADDGTSSSSTSAAAISSNDFLTLLVTEMKNQDPTATTDPNEYINQLVNVNSLQQLISINQNLSTALGTPNSTSGAASAVPAVASTLAPTGTSQASIPSAISSAAHRTSGNLTAPAAAPAAQTVAHALGGLPHAQSIAGRMHPVN